MRSSRRSSPSRPAIVGLVRGAGLVFVVIVAGSIAGVLAGCASSGATPGTLAVHDAWIREPMGGGMSAGYLVIDNATTQADVLTGVTIPAGGTVTLHRTTTDPSGMTGMSPVDAIHVPAGGTVTLEPGGFHLMIDGLAGAKVGDRVELRLQFQHAGTITVQAEVRAS